MLIIWVNRGHHHFFSTDADSVVIHRLVVEVNASHAAVVAAEQVWLWRAPLLFFFSEDDHLLTEHSGLTVS